MPLLPINLSESVSFSFNLRFQRFLRSHDRRNKTYGFAMMEEKLSVDPEDPEFELLCVSKPKASVLDHSCSYICFTLS